MDFGFAHTLSFNVLFAILNEFWVWNSETTFLNVNFIRTTFRNSFGYNIFSNMVFRLSDFYLDSLLEFVGDDYFSYRPYAEIARFHSV